MEAEGHDARRERRELAREVTRRRQERRSDGDEERRIREEERKEKEKREEQEARRQGMDIENNVVSLEEDVILGVVEGVGEGEAVHDPAGGEGVAAGEGGEAAAASDEEEDSVGQELEKQAENMRRKEEKEEGILAKMPVNLLELTAELAVSEGLSERQHMFMIAGVYELCGEY